MELRARGNNFLDFSARVLPLLAGIIQTPQSGRGTIEHRSGSRALICGKETANPSSRADGNRKRRGSAAHLQALAAVRLSLFIVRLNFSAVRLNLTRVK